jgi:DNA-directed RNA polymerase subunit omega
MIEELKSTNLINKVGGRFKLTALIQKRLDELVQGARPLIEDTEGKTMLEIVIQEILRDKITAEMRDIERTKTDEEKDQPRI